MKQKLANKKLIQYLLQLGNNRIRIKDAIKITDKIEKEINHEIINQRNQK